MATVYLRAGNPVYIAKLKWSHAAFGAKRGAWFSRSTGKREQPKAEEVRRRWQAVLDAGVDPFERDRISAQSHTIKILAAQYVEARGVGWEPGTAVLNRHTFALLAAYLGPLDVRKITALHVSGFIRQRLQSVSVWTANIDLRNIRALLRWVEEARVVPEYKAPKLRELQVPKKKEHNHFTDEELVRLMSAARQISINCVRMDWLIGLLLYTGMRKGEALSLRWDSVDLRRRLISLPPEITKENYGRLIPVGDALRGLLEEAREVTGGGERVFPLSMISGNVRDAFERVKDAAGVSRPLAMKHLRATAIYGMFRAGMQPKEVQEIVGHSSSTTTMQYYMTVSMEEKAREMNRHDARLGAILVQPSLSDDKTVG